MRGPVLPMLALGVCCVGHLLVPVLLAAGPATLVGLATGAAPVALAVAVVGVVCAVRLHRRRPAPPVPRAERG